MAMNTKPKAKLLTPNKYYLKRLIYKFKERKGKPIITKKWNYNPNHISLAIITNECCTPCSQSPPKKETKAKPIIENSFPKTKEQGHAQ